MLSAQDINVSYPKYTLSPIFMVGSGDALYEAIKAYQRIKETKTLERSRENLGDLSLCVVCYYGFDSFSWVMVSSQLLG